MKISSQGSFVMGRKVGEAHLDMLKEKVLVENGVKEALFSSIRQSLYCKLENIK